MVKETRNGWVRVYNYDLLVEDGKVVHVVIMHKNGDRTAGAMYEYVHTKYYTGIARLSWGYALSTVRKNLYSGKWYVH